MINIKDYEAMMMLDLPGDERGQAEALLAALDKGFAELTQVDTDGVEPLVSVLSLSNVLREDVAEKLLSREEVLENAPERDGGFFKAPGTLD